MDQELHEEEVVHLVEASVALDEAHSEEAVQVADDSFIFCSYLDDAKRVIAVYQDATNTVCVYIHVAAYHSSFVDSEVMS